MVYLDSCVLVAALTKEERSADVIRWMDKNRDAGFAYSEWVATEFSAALSTKVRRKEVDTHTQQGTLNLFKYVIWDSFRKLRISDKHLTEATRLATDYRSGIRAGDALHLAICLGFGEIRLCTLDKKMSEAGLQLGVETLLL